MGRTPGARGPQYPVDPTPAFSGFWGPVSGMTPELWCALPPADHHGWLKLHFPKLTLTPLAGRVQPCTGNRKQQSWTWLLCLQFFQTSGQLLYSWEICSLIWLLPNNPEICSPSLAESHGCPADRQYSCYPLTQLLFLVTFPLVSGEGYGVHGLARAAF